MVSPENLRAALIAASSMYPDGYGAIKQLATFTATQHVQMVFDRAEEMAAWLDAKEQGQNPAAAEVIKDVRAARRAANPEPRRVTGEQWRGYIDWAVANDLRDSPSNQERYLDTLPLD